MNAQDGLGHIDLAHGGHRTCDPYPAKVVLSRRRLR
jgi:hypothetical protein